MRTHVIQLVVSRQLRQRWLNASTVNVYEHLLGSMNVHNITIVTEWECCDNLGLRHGTLDKLLLQSNWILLWTAFTFLLNSMKYYKLCKLYLRLELKWKASPWCRLLLISALHSYATRLKWLHIYERHVINKSLKHGLHPKTHGKTFKIKSLSSTRVSIFVKNSTCHLAFSVMLGSNTNFECFI